MAEATRTSISTDPADYMSGPTGGQTSRTDGGTTSDGGVARFGGSDTTTVEQPAPVEQPAEQPAVIPPSS